MSELRRALERLVPTADVEGNWERVLADARRRRLPRLGLVAPLAVAAAGLAVLALAWPLGSERSAGVLERALAAMGEGPVVHVVYLSDWGPARVDLTTGEVTKVRAQSEVWYDRGRGSKHVWRLDGAVQHEHVVAPRDLAARQEEYLLALAENYRAALERGNARVIGPGRVGDRRVVWIRVRSEWLPDVQDGRNHLFAEEVAVDRETYEPVYARSTRDGRAFPGGGSAIAKLERVAADDVDFAVSERARSLAEGFTGRTDFGTLLEPDDFAGAVGGAAFWLGRSHDGKPLADAREYLVRRRPSRGGTWETRRGLYLFYGKLRRRGGVPLRAASTPNIVLEEFRDPPAFWFGWSYAPAAREGVLLVARPTQGMVLRDGTYVSIKARSTRSLIAAALALRRAEMESRPRVGLDVAAIAERITSTLGGRVDVTGGNPVAPRPIARTRGRLVQTGTGKGAVIRLFSGGVAHVDTRALDPSVRRLVRRDLSCHCFRVRADDPHGGGIGPVPPRGVTWITILGHGTRGRTPILRPPFDACELGGAGLGRNWLPRFDWHGMVEVPLTRRGRRFFEERAAARELAHFVRNGTRRTARIRLRAGLPAPPAKRLRDPSRPYIAVTSRGERFRASLTAPTGRRFFIEIVRGRIARRNTGRLAFVH